jgi:hypothetical protein
MWGCEMIDSPWNLMRAGKTQAAIEQMRRALADKTNSSTIMQLGVGLLWALETDDEIDPLSPLFLSRLWYSECHLARFLAAHIDEH